MNDAAQSVAIEEEVTPDAAAIETDAAALVAAESEDIAAAAPEETEAEPAASESDDEPSTADSDAESQESESVDFTDLLTDLPPNDVLLKDHVRIPQASKDAITGLADKVRAEREVTAPLGGIDGAKTFAPVANVLDKANPTSEDFQGAIGSMMSRNAQSTVGMLLEASEALLFNTGKTADARQLAQLGDAVLERRFGDGITAAEIEKYALLKQGGVNIDDELSVFNREGAGSALIENLQNTVAEQKEAIQKLTTLVENPDQIPQRNVGSKDLDDEIANRFAEGINPFRERVRWDKESALTRVLSGHLLAELKGTDAYREVLKFIDLNGGLRKGGAIPMPVELLLNSIINMGKGRFDVEARAINTALRTRTETSRNARVEKQVKETKPKSVAVGPVNQSRLSSMYGDTLADKIKTIYSPT